jgi:hypothetical protein
MEKVAYKYVGGWFDDVGTLRFLRLAERRDWDSARSSDKKDLNSAPSRRG